MNNNKVKVGVANKEGQLGFVFSRGGLREGSGRKSIGVTKKISLTLTEDMWGKSKTIAQSINFLVRRLYVTSLSPSIQNNFFIRGR